MTSELFYGHVLNMNRGSLRTRHFRHIYLCVLKYRFTTNGLVSGDFSGETGSRAWGLESVTSGFETLLKSMSHKEWEERERADQLILHMFFNVQNENWWADQGHTGRSWETTKGGSFRLVIVLSTASAHCASILFEFLSRQCTLGSGLSSHFKGRVGFFILDLKNGKK